MADKSLQSFWNDKETYDNVKAYFEQFLIDEAVKSLFDSGAEDAYAVAEAKKVIDKAFDNLDTLFEKKGQKRENINQSR